MAIKLPRLPINWKEQPQLFERYWNDSMTSIETTLNAILDIPEIKAALAEVTGDTGLANSYPTGVTIESFNDGADCHVDISDHMRVYGGGISVPVTGGTLLGIPHDTIVRIYYDQASRAGGVVTYEWTSDAATAAQTGDRHSVGSTVTQRAAEMDSVLGGAVQPPGFAIP